LKRSFLTGEELGAFELRSLLDRALEVKKGRTERVGGDALSGRSVALVFEKPSTRTRVSFEVGVAELGGTPLVLRGEEMQLARGESVADTARVLSRFLDAIVIRSVLMPAVLQLFGRRTWAFPTWLDQRLPRLAIEPANAPAAEPDHDHAGEPVGAMHAS